jgi:hypothetical protein
MRANILSKFLQMIEDNVQTSGELDEGNAGEIVILALGIANHNPV